MNRTVFRRSFVFLLLALFAIKVIAGDDASGTVPYRLDLSQRFTTYSITSADKQWGETLARKFNYEGTIFHFARTSLPLQIGDRAVNGTVYQCIEHSDIFYVLEGDAMLQLGSRWPYSPGVGGFSLHAPKSRNFLVALNFSREGVPFVSSSPVTKSVVAWKGSPERNRLR